MLDIAIPGCIEAAGVELDFRRMQLPRNLKHHYGPPLASACWEMRDIEKGDKVNVDEGREVGHYWLRNPDLAPSWKRSIEDALSRIEAFHEEGFKGRFDNILWIGIGGSGLGPQMLYEVLRTPGAKPRMFFFDNTDPDGFRRTLQEMGLGGLRQTLEKTLTVVVSKSGTTPETNNGMLVAKHEYEKCQLSFEQHAVAITVPGGKLDKLAGPEDAEDINTIGPEWLTRFPTWNWVSGRTSLFSPVGLLPPQLLGFNVRQLREGAKAMDDATRNTREFNKNASLQLAAAWYHTVETRGLRNMVVLPYCDRLAMLSKYLQQLIMESLGKNGKGITVFGNKGSTDQHSYVQQLREGYPDFFATFIRVLTPVAKDDDWDIDSESGVTVSDYLAAFQEGTAQALSDAGRPSMRLTIEKLDERSLGALVALFERAVGYYGALLGVNSYHQPGVEAGKKAARSILDVQQWLVTFLSGKRGTAVSVGKIVEEIKKEPSLTYVAKDASLIYDTLDRLCRCGRFELTKNTDGAENTADATFRAD